MPGSVAVTSASFAPAIAAIGELLSRRITLTRAALSLRMLGGDTVHLPFKLWARRRQPDQPRGIWSSSEFTSENSIPEI
jgi:hypothetical protein